MKISKILLITLLVLMVLTFTTKVFAVNVDLLTQITDGSNSSTGTNQGSGSDDTGLGGLSSGTQQTGTQQTGTQQTQQTQTTTPTAQTPVATTTSTTETKLPNTGDAEDIVIFALVAVFTVISVIAFKKIKEYNKI